MVWPFDFSERTYISSRITVRSLPIAKTRILRAFNQQIIQASDLRIILLCGANAVHSVIPDDCPQIHLELPAAIVEAFLEIDRTEIRRIYLKFPYPVLCLWNASSLQARKMSELIKFAAAITHTPQIASHWIQSALTLTRLVWHYTLEREGNHQQMTLETMKPEIRAWVHRKGFTKDEDITTLAKLGDSLVHSLLLLCQVLPECPKEYKPATSKPVIPRTGKKPANKFDKNQIQNVKNLYQELNKSDTLTDEVVSESQSMSNSDIVHEPSTSDRASKSQSDSKSNIVQEFSTGGTALESQVDTVSGDYEETADDDLQEMKSLVFEKCRSLSATFGVEDEFPTDDVPSLEELHENF
jgi:hypothetical protein